MVAAAGSTDWIGVRVGLRGADLVLCRAGVAQVLQHSQGSKAGAACAEIRIQHRLCSQKTRWGLWINASALYI